MTIIDQKLAKLAKLLERLPAEAQADVLDAFEAHVETLAQEHMTDAQRDTVKARMMSPREYATVADVETLLSRYRRNP